MRREHVTPGERMAVYTALGVLLLQNQAVSELARGAIDVVRLLAVVFCVLSMIRACMDAWKEPTS